MYLLGLGSGPVSRIVARFSARACQRPGDRSTSGPLGGLGGLLCHGRSLATPTVRIASTYVSVWRIGLAALARAVGPMAT